MKIFENIEMKNYSNMKIGGIAKELIFIEKKEELKEIIDTRENIFLIGNGTNTLIDDEYLDISFVSLKELKNITVEEKTNEYDLVRVESGLDLDDLIKYMEKKRLFRIGKYSGNSGFSWRTC